MHVDEAKLENGWLCLKTQPSEALKWLYKFKPNNYEITQVRKKRSLDANAYMWVLLDRLSEKIGVPKTELYQQQIREIGGVSETYCGKTDAIEKLCKEWENRGLGWQAETFPSKLEGCTNVTLYYGSSAFNTHQMSRMIDSLVADCKEVGIEVKPQEEINSLLEAWHEK